jgi:hypothetical protein
MVPRRVQVKYLLLIARLRWWWVCGDGWLWIIIWIVVVISWCIGVIITTLILISICGT